MWSHWQRTAAIGTWVYTAITALILVASVYQTHLIRQNNIVSSRAFVSPTVQGMIFGTRSDKAPVLGVVKALGGRHPPIYTYMLATQAGLLDMHRSNVPDTD